MTAVGVDIEDVARFKMLVRNPRFLKRVYTRQELAYCNSKKNKLQHFAARFAAKEATWKALSDVIRRRKLSLAHVDIGVANDAAGKPCIVLPRTLNALARKISLSLSHTRTTVVAVALVQG